MRDRPGQSGARSRRHGGWIRCRHSTGARKGQAVSETYDGRRDFGLRLRRIRNDAGLSGKELARILGWAGSKVSRLERGHQTATEADVDAWIGATGASAQLRDPLVAELAHLRADREVGRRRGSVSPRPRRAVLDEGATSLAALQTALVPELLQTAGYARAVLSGRAELRGEADIEAAVAELMRRQDVLYQVGYEFRFLMTEAALRARIGSVAIHREQLARLVELSRVDGVALAVLPLDAVVASPPGHGFEIFGERLVRVVDVDAERAIRDPATIALYARLFELYWAAALHGGAATAMITRIAAELPTAP